MLLQEREYRVLPGQTDQALGQARPAAAARGDLGHSLERPVDDLVGHLAVLEPGPVSLDEVLIRIGRVELHLLHVVAAAGYVAGELARDIGLARSGWPVEHHLALVGKQPQRP